MPKDDAWLQSMVRLGLRQIGWQRQMIESANGRATGLLAFDGALAAALVLADGGAVHSAAEVLALIAFACSAVCAIFTMRELKMDLGLDLHTLLANLHSGEMLPDEVEESIVVELADAVQANAGLARRKEVLWIATATLLVVSIVLSIVSLVVGG